MATAVPVDEVDDSDVQADDEPFLLDADRKREESEMDLTPMIDVTFQLLIFFVVTSKMDPASDASGLPLAKFGFAVAAKVAVIIDVKPGAGDDAIVTRFQGDAFAADKEAQEAEIAAYVEAGFAGRAPFKGTMENVIVRAAKGVKSREVARVCKACAQADVELDRINIAVMEAE